MAVPEAVVHQLVPTALAMLVVNRTVMHLAVSLDCPVFQPRVVVLVVNLWVVL